jgi:chitin disaccharide deacetylase
MIGPSPGINDRRRLIVNADDFGLSAGVNEGIARCHEQGIVTSASLMVRWPAAGPAAEYARARPTLSVGLHLDLGEWTYRGDEWVPLYQVIRLEDPLAIRGEVVHQLETFRRVMGRDPTHIDSHQHVHHLDVVRDALAEVTDPLGVPVRQRSGALDHLGAFYGQSGKGHPVEDAISVTHLIRILNGLPKGTTELGCHPGLQSDVHGMYVAEREREVIALCDPQVRAALVAEGIELISFRDVTPCDFPIATL